MKLFRIACFLYWAFLTVLLLTPDPKGLLGLEKVEQLPSDTLAHLTFFTLLAILVHTSRLPWPRWMIYATLLGYAFAAESLQYFVPPREVELKDFAMNFSGLALGTCLYIGGVVLWRRLKHKKHPSSSEAIDMNAKKPTHPQAAHFRIIVREGALTEDVFLVPSEQPATIKTGCVLAINRRDGSLQTVHGSRLVPTEAGQSPQAATVASVCLKCGKVAGVVEDAVICPYENDGPCKVLEEHR
jgi:VanZ family protein